MSLAFPYTLVFRANTTGVLSFGGRARASVRSRSITVVNGGEYTLTNMDSYAVQKAKELQDQGYISIISGADAATPVLVRKSPRNEITVLIGNGSALPNDGTARVLELDTVSFTFGNAGIDGASAAAQIAAFKTAFEANTTLAELGLVWAGGVALGTNQGLVVLNGDSFSGDWTAFLANVSASGGVLDVVTSDVDPVDDTLLKTTVLASREVRAGDVTRGFVAIDTGLTDLEALLTSEIPAWLTATVHRAVAATRVLTVATGQNFADSEGVNIGTRSYVFVDALSGAADEVLIGADGNESLDNLAAAINGYSGEGTLYGTGTEPHALVVATVNLLQLTITAKTKGAAANSIALVEGSPNASWAGGTMTGGVDAAPVLHDGARYIADERVYVLTNSGSVDFAAGDIITLMAIGTN